MRIPRVLVSGCNRQLGDHPFHVVGHKYVNAVRLAGCLPIVVPNMADEAEMEAWLGLADGLLLTGSRSNVHPRHYGAAPADDVEPVFDEARDAWTLPILRRAIDKGLPLLAICRGFQELNVALGGSLHQAVQEQPGLADHREPADAPPEIGYAARHEIRIEAGGLLERLLETSSVQVNSLHGQGLDRLAEGLRVEARAPDGLVEAVSVRGHAGFALGVQWHPEWLAGTNPVSMALLQAFGQACRAHANP
jgi:putative glutamine amidotransferase